MITLSDAITRVQPSATMAMTARASELRRAGRDVLSLSAGEPDFGTPEHICQAAANAVARGETRYTGVDGTRALKDAVSAHFAMRLSIETTPAEVTVGSGGKQLIFNALLATLNVGDEVIIPAPYWVSYPEIVRFAGATPIFVESSADAGWRLDLSALEAAITDRTKWLLLCSPCNPSGVVMNEDELSKLAAMLRKHPQLLVMSDELYADIVFDGRTAPSLLAVAPDLAERVLVVDGVSKSWAMTGWRIGFGRGPAALINGMRRLQSHSTSCPAAPSQAAALAALTGPKDFLEETRLAYQRRRDLVLDHFSDVDGINAVAPEGAFYVFFGIAGWIGRSVADGPALTTDVDAALCLLDQTGVALVPGTGFGASPALRLSFAASDAVLDDACARIKDFARQLKRQ